jgi:hypothetical protein
MEARTKAKWEKDGWELVDQGEPGMLRSKLTFRRPKKSIRVPLLIAGGAIVAGMSGLVILGLVTGGFQPASTASTPSTPLVAEPTPSEATTSPVAQSPAADTPVTDSEVISAFQSFFAERAANGALFGKAVTNVSYSNRKVRVTFDPAAAGVSQELFDQVNPFDNLAEFAAVPVAFNNSVGNRLRPAIDSIETVTPAGASLGTLSATEILAINGLRQ